MGRGEISWQGRTPEGFRRKVYAKRVGQTWKFYVREKRYDRWQDLAKPALEDWLELLDGVRRRIARRLVRPEEELHLRQTIAQLFPGQEP
jgi:hypothetical protein